MKEVPLHFAPRCTWTFQKKCFFEKRAVFVCNCTKNSINVERNVINDHFKIGAGITSLTRGGHLIRSTRVVPTGFGTTLVGFAGSSPQLHNVHPNRAGDSVVTVVVEILAPIIKSLSDKGARNRNPPFRVCYCQGT
jgi:hypothetical protein